MGRQEVVPNALPLQLDLFASDTMQIGLSPYGNPTKEAVPEKEQENPKSSLKKRAITFDGVRIEYEFRRSKRRSIGFLINENGLRVTAPRWATLKSVEEAIKEKRPWITDKLLHFFHQHQKRQETPFRLMEGATLPYLGSKFILRLQNGPTDDIFLNETTRELIVTSANIEMPSVVENNLRIWLQKKAEQIFAKRMPIYASLLGVSYRSFSLSSAKQRWGSCSVSGNIRLNWRLIYLPLSLIDYVIAHELAHLHQMNHSKRFWEIVSQVYPDYKTARKQLGQESSPILSLL